MGIKRTGDWNAAKKRTEMLGSNINTLSRKTLMRIGLMTERKVVKYIQSQPSVWPELNPNYKKWKEKNNYSELMLRKTGDYINRITSTVSQDGMSVLVGVKKGVKNSKGDDLIQIGAILEYGTKANEDQARPHFRPVIKLMRREVITSGLIVKDTKSFFKNK